MYVWKGLCEVSVILTFVLITTVKVERLIMILSLPFRKGGSIIRGGGAFIREYLVCMMYISQSWLIVHTEIHFVFHTSLTEE